MRHGHLLGLDEVTDGRHQLARRFLGQTTIELLLPDTTSGHRHALRLFR
jgi:hypothetical protein